MPLITTPFDRHSTATDIITGIDLTHRRAIVTGAFPVSASRPLAP